MAQTLGYPLHPSLLGPGQFAPVTLVSQIVRQSQNFDFCHMLSR